ncbi:hypothetical protein H2248_006071, partial [Termitomyces sp. 'cryptogamus']
MTLEASPSAHPAGVPLSSSKIEYLSYFRALLQHHSRVGGLYACSTASVNNSGITWACGTLWPSRTTRMTPGTKLGLEGQAGDQGCPNLWTWRELLKEPPAAKDTPINFNQFSSEHRSLTLTFTLTLPEHCAHSPTVSLTI